MFSSETGYRLGEFILIERGGALLTWVLQCPMGMQRSGKCHVIGDILIIMPWEKCSPGYLRMEFHDLLMKLTHWTKTNFYCITSGLRNVETGKRIESEVVEQLAIKTVKCNSLTAIIPGSFRLGRYKITASENNTVVWQSLGSHGKLLSGTGHVKSGILILDSPTMELHATTRKSFYTDLKLQQIWNKTRIWCHAESIKMCHNQEGNNNVLVTKWTSRLREDFLGARILSLLRIGYDKESISDVYVSEGEHPKSKCLVLGGVDCQSSEVYKKGFFQSIIILKKICANVASKWIDISKANTSKMPS